MICLFGRSERWVLLSFFAWVINYHQHTVYHDMMPKPKSKSKKPKRQRKSCIVQLPKPPPKAGCCGKELSDVEKGMVIMLHWVYGVYATVSTIVCHPWPTVKNFIVLYYIHSSMENHAYSGRQHKLSKCDWHAILNAVQNYRRYIHEQIQLLHAPHICLHTIDWLLGEHNIIKWIMNKLPKLTEEQHVYN